MPDQVRDKSIIVTGGASGIGRALCIGLAAEGGAIAVCDRDLDGAEATAARVRAQGGTATPIQVDVARASQVEDMVRRVLGAYGKIDVLVNAAGIFPRNTVLEMSEEEWRQVLDVNLTGAFLCCKAVAGEMIKRRTGKIVNLVSGSAVSGALNGAHYAASKGGLSAFTVTLGMELGPYGINVNGIAPGPTDTPMARGGADAARASAPEVPVNRRLGQPEDVVAPVLFFCTDASKMMFGQLMYLKTP